MTTSQHDVSGVGQPGFVARHGLYTAEQAAAAEAVANEIRARDLRTVRLIVVDQHGMPRAQGAVARGGDRGHVQRPRLLRRDLQPRHRQPGIRASLRRGRRVRHRRVHRVPGRRPSPGPVHVPHPALGRSDRLDAVRRLFLLRRADAAGRSLAHAPDARAISPTPATTTWRASRSSTTSSRSTRTTSRRRTPASSRRHRQSASSSAATSTSPRCGWTASPSTLEVIRDGLGAVGLPPRSMEDEWGPGQMEFSFSPIGGLAAADAVVLFRSAVKQMCQRRGPARDLHVPAGPAELLLLRLAPARVAAVPAGRPQRVRLR